MVIIHVDDGDGDGDDDYDDPQVREGQADRVVEQLLEMMQDPL